VRASTTKGGGIICQPPNNFNLKRTHGATVVRLKTPGGRIQTRTGIKGKRINVGFLLSGHSGLLNGEKVSERDEEYKLYVQKERDWSSVKNEDKPQEGTE